MLSSFTQKAIPGSGFGVGPGMEAVDIRMRCGLSPVGTPSLWDGEITIMIEANSYQMLMCQTLLEELYIYIMVFSIFLVIYEIIIV